MTIYIPKAGAANAPYPEVKATQYLAGTTENYSIELTIIGKDDSQYATFQGNRSGAKGTEILHNGDFIVKVSASIFAMERQAFRGMYKKKVSPKAFGVKSGQKAQ